MPQMEMHFATVWESFADVIGDADALVNGDTRRSWTEFDDRAARLASVLSTAGLRPDSKVGMYLYNGNEYSETQFAAFKIRAVPVNVNYRYLDEELWYLLDNSDAEAIVFHSSLGDRVGRVVERLAKIKVLIAVDDGGDGHVDGALRYEDVIATADPAPRITRSEDDHYMLYTGGTTGMPKGVVYATGGLASTFIEGTFPLIGLTPSRQAGDLAALVRSAIEAGNRLISIPGCPLMHGTGVWLGAMAPHLTGGSVVTLTERTFSADEMFRTIASERATNVVIVGDSFCKPLIRAWDQAGTTGQPYDTSSLKVVISSGVMWTSEVKHELLERIPHVLLADFIGSSEGSMGANLSAKGMPAVTGKFSASPHTKVFTEDGRPVGAGTGEVGLIAAGGNVPLGYYKDDAKTAQTFRVIDGVRYAFAGDLATVNADGTISLIGRGSMVINTAGEKVFPEEVEEAVKRVPGVRDCLVVGVDDDRFGQSVTAVVSLEDRAIADEPAIIASVKQQLAGFKAPKRVVFVAEVPRAPNGKADYQLARQYAVDALGSA
jgi:3-oxocholest-4-en-26-oate---CoA ligase